MNICSYIIYEGEISFMSDENRKMEDECSSIIDEIKDFIPVDEEVQDLAEFFRVFGDPTRIKILSLLSEKALCVHSISGALDMQQTAISHQLKILRQSRLVRYRKEGRHVFYSLCDNHIKEIISTGLEHIRED